MQTLPVVRSVKKQRDSHAKYITSTLVVSFITKYNPYTSDGNKTSSSHREPQPLPSVQYTGQQTKRGNANFFQRYFAERSNEQE